MTTRSLAVLALLCSACVDGSPVEPMKAPEPRPAVLHNLATTRGDTLRLVADSTYRAKAAGTRYWVVGRYWFTTSALDFHFLCAAPNASGRDAYFDCSVWEKSPGVLMDPFSVFLRDSAVKEWVRYR